MRGGSNIADTLIRADMHNGGGDRHVAFQDARDGCGESARRARVESGVDRAKGATRFVVRWGHLVTIACLVASQTCAGMDGDNLVPSNASSTIGANHSSGAEANASGLDQV